jgi:hypothetical protein
MNEPCHYRPGGEEPRCGEPAVMKYETFYYCLFHGELRMRQDEAGRIHERERERKKHGL